MKEGYKTTEFWLAAGATVVSLVAVVLGLSPADTQTLTSSVSAAVVAVGTLMTSGLTVWGYIQARTDLKLKALDTDGDGDPDETDPDDDGDGIIDQLDVNG